MKTFFQPSKKRCEKAVAVRERERRMDACAEAANAAEEAKEAYAQAVEEARQELANIAKRCNRARRTWREHAEQFVADAAALAPGIREGHLRRKDYNVVKRLQGQRDALFNELHERDVDVKAALDETIWGRQIHTLSRTFHAPEPVGDALVAHVMRYGADSES